MMTRSTQRRWWGRCAAMVVATAVVLAGPVATAQQPGGNGNPPPAEPTPPTTQEAEAWRQLLEMEAQFKREQEAKEQAARVAAAAAAREAQPPPTTQPAPGSDPEAAAEQEAEGTPAQTEAQNLAELEERARVAAARLQEQQTAVSDVPADFVGPPLGLANDPSIGASGLAPGTVIEPPVEPVVATAPGGTDALGTVGGAGAVEEEPADGRDTWFVFDRMPWEEVVRLFAEKIGKPLLDAGNLIIGGELTYVSPRSFTKDEAVDELNLLMQMQGYRFVEEQYHIRVLPVNEMHMHVPLDMVFPSVAAFHRANPRDMDYVTVFYQVEDRSAGQYVDMFQSALSDNARIDALAESNQIRITSIARDVRKFLYLKDLIDLSERDPRQLRFFDIKTNAVDIEQRVRAFLQLRPRATVRMAIDPRTRRPMPQAATDETEDVLMVSDERTNSIIVKATPAKLLEIENLIRELDKPADIGEFRTQVHEVKYADATEIATLLNQIFQQEQGQGAQPNWQAQRQLEAMRRIQAQQAAQARARAAQQGQPVQPGQPVVVQPNLGPSPEDILAEGIYERARKTIRMVADARRNLLIVYANDEGQERVAKLVGDLDKAKTDNFRTFVVEQANVTELAPLLTEIVAGMTQSVSRGRPSIVPDWSRSVLHVVAEPDQMEQIEALIVQLDVASPELERYVVTLERLRPSQVAQMVQALLASGARGSVTAPRGPRFPGRPMPMQASGGGSENFQVIPLDEAGVLIVLCTPVDWEKIEQTITMWDERAMSSAPRLETYEVLRGNASTIAQTLTNFYRFFDHPVLGRSAVAIQAEGTRIMVQAVEPAQQEIAALLEVLDVDDAADRIEILPLAHADAQQVAQQVAQHFAQRGARGAPGRGPIIQAEPVTNALIVQAEAADLEKIMDLAQRIDEEVGRSSPEQRFFDLKFADAREVANAVQALFGAGGGRAGRPGMGGQVRAVASNARVIVEAPREKLAQIEAFIAELDDPQGNEIVIKTIKLPGADVTAIARRLQTAFREKRNMSAIFDADPSSETILLTCTRDALSEAERLIEESAEASRGVAPLVEFRQMQYAQATDASEWLREQLINYMQTQLGRGAAQLIKVTADARTNRVVINGPEVAVRYGMTLLDNFDVEPGGPPISIMQTEARKLSGLDLRALANSLTQTFRADPPRPDRLVPSFQHDESTEILIINAPKDMYERINELVTKFEIETQDQRLEQKFIAVKNAEVTYVADQVRAILSVRVAGMRGRQVVERIQIQPDTRQNQMVVTAPAFVIPMAEELVAQLDQVGTTPDRMKLIALENADATAVAGILQNLLRERIRQKRDLSIAAEPMTNSLIVNGDRSDFEEIERWSRELDSQAVVRVSEPVIYELRNANPWEVLPILNATFAPKRGQANRLADMSFNVIGGQALVVQAPEEELPKIAEMIAQLDAIGLAQGSEPRVVDLRHAAPDEIAATINQMYGRSGPRRPGQGEQSMAQASVSNGALVISAPKKQFDQIMELIDELDRPSPEGVQVRTFTLKTLSAVQVQIAVAGFLRDAGANMRKGDLKPGAFAEPMTNTLVVLAPAATMPFVESLINELEGKGPRRSDVRAYDLVNMRAEQIAQNVDQMLKAKVVEREGARQSTVQTGVFFHPGGVNRLFVYAPEDYQEMAAQLIAMVDVEGSGGEVTHIVSLVTSDANALAQALTQGLGQTGQAATLRVAPVQASGALIIRGLPKDVAEAEQLVAQLEGTMSNAPELRAFAPKYVSPDRIRTVIEEVYPLTGRGTVDRVTVSVSDYDNRVFVNATRRLMREVQALIELVDVSPYGEGEDPLALPGGRIVQFVDIKRGRASDIAWDARQMFPPESAGGPSIESDWYGEYIIVKCRPEEFERIEAVIREFESRTRQERKIVTLRPNREAAELIEYLRLRGETVEFQRLDVPRQIDTIVEDIWPEGEYPPGYREREGQGQNREAPPAPPARRESAPPARTAPAPSPAPQERERERPAADRGGSAARTAPRVALALSGSLATELVRELEAPAARVESRLVGARATDVPVLRRTVSEGVVRLAAYAEEDDGVPVAPRTARPAAAEPPATGSTTTKAVEREPVRVVEQPDGSLIITGPRENVEDVVDAINTITEDLATGEVIRIFRFRFGDVNAAAEILTMMFDVRQTRMAVPQQPQQQRPQQQPGREGQRDDQQNLMEQMQRMFGGPQAPQQGGRATATPMRIATDPSHNYLIIKCEASLLPEIRQLLRELDIPPGEVQIRVFQLRNLVADEAAAGISDVLGISKVRQRRTAAPGAAARNPQQQLVEMLQQQMVSVAGVEGGAKVERVEIVPNSTTNSLLVSAPPEVMSLIERVITELEALEGREVMGIYHHPLANAKVLDILPLLQEVFSGAASAAGRGRGMSPAALGPVTISGDPRNNTVIFSAQAKDEEAVRRQIDVLDIAGNVADAQLYVCQWGDAAAIAAVLEPLYAARAGRGAPGVGEVRILAEPATNTLLVYAPLDKLDEIFTKVEALDKLQQQAIRELDIVHANPEEVAAKLSTFFGDAAGAGAARPRGRGAATAGGRILIYGDKAAKKLLVRAPDEIYAQIVELLPTLDSPSQDLKLERYQLRYADATSVVESVKSAMQEYLQLARLTGQETDFDAFTVMPDPRTNSVSVVGSDRTFAFVGTVIQAIDVPTPADQKPRFETFVLDEADAQVVAEAINALAAGGSTGPGGRGGARGAGGRDLQVTAVADPVTNAVLVFGRQEDVDFVAQTVIERYEGSIGGRIQIASIPVTNVPPTQIVGFIWQFVEVRAAATGTGRTGRPAGANTDAAGPKIVPNDAEGVLIVQGTRRQIEDVRKLVAEFDSTQFQLEPVRVIQVPRSQDALVLGPEVERIITQAEQAQFASTGRPPRAITIGTDAFTNSLIVSCDPSLYPVVEGIVRQLGDIGTYTQTTTILELDRLSADEAQRIINELQAQRRGSTTPARPGGIRTGTGTTPRPGAIRPTGNFQRGTGGGGGGRGDGRPMRGSRLPTIVPGVETPGWMETYIAALPITPLFTGVLFTEEVAAGDDQVATQPTGRVRLPAGGGQDPAVLDQVITGLSGVSGALKSDVSATAIDSKRLVITGDAEDIEFIKQILAMMEATRSPAIIEVFVLREAKAVALGPVIEQAVQAMTSIRTESPGPQDRFSINIEARSNSLIVAASEELMDMIAELIERLDVPRDEGLGTDFRAVTLQHTRASQAVALLRPRIEELNRLRQVPADAQASISAFDISNSVFIIGTPKDVHDIERMIQMIDIEVDAADDAPSFVQADVILVPVENAQATRIATVLTDMINEQQEAARAALTAAQPGRDFVRTLRLRLPDGRELPALDLQRPIRIIAEEGTNSLLIFSTPKNNEALIEIVRVFDTLPVGADTDVKVFVLKHAGAERVAQLVRDIFADKAPLRRPSEGTGTGLEAGKLPPLPEGVAGGLPYPLSVQHDARSNAVVIVGRSDAVLLAGGLIAELDRPAGDLGVQAHLVGLRHTQAAQLKEKLDTLLADRLRAFGADANTARDSAIIQADERSNQLIVIAADDTFAMVEKLVLELDQAAPYSVVDLRYRRLTYADAGKLQAMIEEVFNAKREAERSTNNRSTDTLTIIADARSNALLLTGTRDYLEEAGKLIDDLDQEFDGGLVFQAIRLRFAAAGHISALLRDMVSNVLTQQESRLKGTPIHITADPVTDTLLIAAAREDMALITRWVEIMDEPSRIGQQLAVIPLGRARAERVSQMATELFAARSGDATTGQIDLNVRHDEATNSVIAFGPPALLGEIEKFVREIDSVEAVDGNQVRFFKLLQANAEDAGELLNRILELRGGTVGGGTGAGGTTQTEADKRVMLVFQQQSDARSIETLRAMRRDIQVIADVRTNSLIVTAPVESMGLMEALVRQVDVPPEDAKLRVMRLINSDAEQMVTMLQELFQRRTTGTTAGATDTERVLVLGEATGGRQEVAFTVDKRTNSLIAAGTPGYLDLVEELVEELDRREIDEREAEIYSPRNLQATVLAESISQWSQEERQRLEARGQDISAGVLDAIEVGAIANEDANRVILTFNPRMRSKIMRVVDALDQVQPQVMIQVLILEVSMDNTLELGVEFAFQDLQWAKAGPQDTTTFDYVLGTDLGAAGSGLGGFSFTITGADFNFLFRTLQSEGNLQVLSRPQIVALNNQQALIAVEDDVPYPTGSSTTSTGQLVTTVGRERVGIRLEVTPQINPDGFVQMEIRQEVSDFTDSTVAVGPGLTAPVFLRREAESRVVVRDGETVVLGGLITQRQQNNEQKIPLVGDFPLLGMLFRTQTDQQKRTELLVVLTPRVIRTPEDYRRVSAQERDRLAVIPGEVLTSDLMEGLRVDPEKLDEIMARQRNGEAGTFAPMATPPPLEADREEYGPLRPALRPATPTREPEPGSYDVPVSLLNGARPVVVPPAASASK